MLLRREVNETVKKSSFTLQQHLKTTPVSGSDAQFVFILSVRATLGQTPTLCAEKSTRGHLETHRL